MKISYTAKDFKNMSADELAQIAIQNNNHNGVFRSAPLEYEDEIFLHYALLEKSPEKYSQLMNKFINAEPDPEAGKLFPPGVEDAFSWVAVWCKEGNDRGVAEKLEAFLLEYFEQQDQAFLKKTEEDKITYQFVYGSDITCILYDYSENVRKRWKRKYSDYILPEGRINDLLDFLDCRQRWLGIDPADSMKILYGLGWQPEDVFMAYLIKESAPYEPAIAIDIVAQAVRDYPQRAMALLDTKNYAKYLSVDKYHNLLPKYMLAEWIKFLFLYCDMADRTFLEREHKQKQTALLCREILKEKENPNMAWERFEERLKDTGLLFSNDPVDFEDSKLLKRQRVSLIRAYVSHYQWDFDTWKKTFFGTPASALAKSLIWGFYEQDELKAVFIPVEGNRLVDENGQELTPGAASKLGLVNASEMPAGQIKAWKKALKTHGVKQSFSQLATAADISPDELDGKIVKRFFGAISKHITIVGTAGKWGLYAGRSNRCTCYHMLDPLHKIGAQLTFDSIWSGPEYNSNDEIIRNAIFYKAGDLLFGEAVPESAILHPDELPRRFVQIALQAFGSISGMK